VNVVIDTNILIRFILADDDNQYQSVLKLFAEAQIITIPTIVLCEMVWVLRGYKIERKTIVEQIEFLTQTENVVIADDEVKAGLDLFASGGDFADGVAAYVGRRLAPRGARVCHKFRV